jgi:hypothetical protein
MFQRVMEQGLLDFVRYKDRDDLTGEEKRILHHARQWIFVKKEPKEILDRVMAFSSVCLILDVIPEDVRQLAAELSHKEMRQWLTERAGSLRKNV